MKRKLLFSLRVLLWLLFLGLAGYIALHPARVRYALRDWWRLRGYQTPAHMARLSDQLGLTDQAQKVFYASYPELKDKQGFVAACPFPEQSFVIGCYDGDRIYILDVGDKELESVEPVTAAHELLHALWARQDKDRQQTLSRQLRSVYSSSQDDDLHKLVDKYRAAGNNEDVINSELHSILATEVGRLSPDLEQYYASYFRDRALIVRLYDSYRTTFARNQSQVDDLRSKLDRLKSEINSLESRLSSLRPVIDARRAQLDAYAAAGDSAAYNQLIPDQRADITRYNQLVRGYNARIEQYRDLAKELLAVSLRHNELVDAIDATKVQKLEGQ